MAHSTGTGFLASVGVCRRFTDLYGEPRPHVKSGPGFTGHAKSVPDKLPQITEPHERVTEPGNDPQQRPSRDQTVIKT